VFRERKVSISDENKKSDVKVWELQQDEKELTTEEAKDVRGGLKMAPARASEDKTQTPGI
jgi:hypothetical protein